MGNSIFDIEGIKPMGKKFHAVRLRAMSVIDKEFTFGAEWDYHIDRCIAELERLRIEGTEMLPD